MAQNKVVVELQGGLGNQLFGWAAGYVLSRKLQCDLFLDCSQLSSRGYQLGHFEFSRDLQYVKNSGGWLKKISNKIRYDVFEEQSHNFDPRFERIKTPLILRGYFQSWKYHMPLESELYSKVAQLIEESIQLKSLQNQIEFSECIAIHVRRGDYKDLQMVHGIVGPIYYQRALEEMFRIYQGRLPYVVFSDEPYEAQSVIPGALAYIGPDDIPSPAENMVLMSKCKALIGANSTFSLWAGLVMSPKIKTRIFPKSWFTDKMISETDFVPNHFIRI
jgi:hypothetical protein